MTSVDAFDNVRPKKLVDGIGSGLIACSNLLFLLIGFDVGCTLSVKMTSKCQGSHS